MLGKSFFKVVIVVAVVLVGLLLYPTIGTNYAGVSTAGWLPLASSTFTIVKYLFVAFMVYLAVVHIWHRGET